MQLTLSQEAVVGSYRNAINIHGSDSQRDVQHAFCLSFFLSLHKIHKDTRVNQTCFDYQAPEGQPACLSLCKTDRRGFGEMMRLRVKEGIGIFLKIHINLKCLHNKMSKETFFFFFCAHRNSCFILHINK